MEGSPPPRGDRGGVREGAGIHAFSSGAKMPRRGGCPTMERRCAGRRSAARAFSPGGRRGRRKRAGGGTYNMMGGACGRSRSDVRLVCYSPSFPLFSFFLFSLSEVLWTRLRRVIFLTKNPATSMVPKPSKAPGWCSLRLENQYVLNSHVQRWDSEKE